MEIWASCTVEGCKARSRVEGPFIPNFAEEADKARRAAGWAVGDGYLYCPDHVHLVPEPVKVGSKKNGRPASPEVPAKPLGRVLGDLRVEVQRNKVDPGGDIWEGGLGIREQATYATAAEIAEQPHAYKEWLTVAAMCVKRAERLQPEED